MQTNCNHQPDHHPNQQPQPTSKPSSRSLISSIKQTETQKEQGKVFTLSRSIKRSTEVLEEDLGDGREEQEKQQETKVVESGLGGQGGKLGDYNRYGDSDMNSDRNRQLVKAKLASSTIRGQVESGQNQQLYQSISSDRSSQEPQLLKQPPNQSSCPPHPLHQQIHPLYQQIHPLYQQVHPITSKHSPQLPHRIHHQIFSSHHPITTPHQAPTTTQPLLFNKAQSLTEKDPVQNSIGGLGRRYEGQNMKKEGSFGELRWEREEVEEKGREPVMFDVRGERSQPNNPTSSTPFSRQKSSEHNPPRPSQPTPTTNPSVISIPSTPTSKQIKYPSLHKASSQQYPQQKNKPQTTFLKEQEKQSADFDDEHDGKTDYIIATERQGKNYAVVAKMVTSEEPSPNRRRSELDSDEENTVHFIEPLPKTNIRESKQEIPNNRKQPPSLTTPQQSNLFYISISGQQMYPSLDLKKKAEQLQQQKQQLEKQQLEKQKPQNNQSSQVVSGKKMLATMTRMRQAFKARNMQSQLQSKPQKRQQNNSSGSSNKNSPSTIELPYRIRIKEYRSQYFLKIQTQVFQLQVLHHPPHNLIEMKTLNPKSPNPNPKAPTQQPPCSPLDYTINRRFSDFSFLHQSITTNHLGYITYPFPSKTLQSFVKIKLQSLIGGALSQTNTVTEAEKVQLIERRIEELQRFVNFLLEHEELKYSEEVAIFLCEDQETYQRSRERIEKYVQEYKELQSCHDLLTEGKKNIKKVIETGVGMVMKWWGSAEEDIPVKQILNTNKKIEKVTKHSQQQQSREILVDSTGTEEEKQFKRYWEVIGVCLAKFGAMERSLLKIIEINEKFIQFRDMDTEFDYLIKLCTKVSSGKQYHSHLLTTLQHSQLLYHTQTTRHWLQQSRDQLTKRLQLKELIQTLKQSLVYSSDESSKISKLERRVDRFNKNFRFGVGGLLGECEGVWRKGGEVFGEVWQGQCKRMGGIWKV